MNMALFFIGIYIALAIYHLLIFSGRRRDLSNLLFALFCLCYSFFLYWNSIYQYTPYYRFSLFHLVYSGTCIVFAMIFIYLPHTIFDLKKTGKKSIILSSVLFVLGTAFILLFGIIKHVGFLRGLYSMLSAAMLIYIGIILHSLVLKKNIRDRNELIILIGYILLSGLLLFHTLILAVSLEMVPSMIIRMFFIVMTFSFSWSLTNNFNKEHRELLVLKNSLEQKVQERTRQLKEAKEQKETFFINIAHEIKTPLTIVSNVFSEFYKSYERPEEISLIRTGLEKMKRDIVNFLDLHKLESGRFFYNHEQIVDVSGMLKQSVSLFSRSAGSKGIRLEVTAAPEALYTKIDPFAFDRIANNLIENSIKYNNPGGRVSISLSRTSRAIVLEVSDTGLGIPAEVIEHVFRPYYQISHKKRNIQGLGMGLAIVKEICDDIGAGISLESKENEGTRIAIGFRPYEKKETDTVSTGAITGSDAGAPEDRPVTGDSRSNGERPTVLLVEDNEDLLSFLVQKLNNEYNVACARNGKEGLEEIGRMESPPDIIISDIMMDEMDGQTFRTKINENTAYCSVPFIFLTAQSSHQTKLQCLADGAVDYIIKPFSVDELRYKIASLIRMRRALSEKNLEEVKKRVDRHIKDRLQKQVDESFQTVKGHVYTRLGISDQEIRVIAMLKQGLLYKEIAANLHVSINSVRTYVRRIHKKLDINSTAQLFEALS
ncbi:MAG: response regulator [Spirochaetales bacterium]|nr:response regulator [Spirochaetales bacterium]